MRCEKCNREIDEVIGKCSFCDETITENIRVLTPEEKSHYQGVTIDTNNETNEERSRYDHAKPNQKIYVRKIDFNGSNWITRIAIFVLLAAIAAFLLFVAVPVALIGIGVGVVVWLVLIFFKG